MTGYGEALKQGLAVHEQAERARSEMDEVLAVASKEVTEVLQIEISLQFKPLDRPRRPENTSEAALGLPAPRERYTALIAQGPNGSKVLAEAKFGELGYPVSLRWANEFYSIPDRNSFEEVIQRLLAHGATGAKFSELVSSK